MGRIERATAGAGRQQQPTIHAVFEEARKAALAEMVREVEEQATAGHVGHHVVRVGVDHVGVQVGAALQIAGGRGAHRARLVVGAANPERATAPGDGAVGVSVRRLGSYDVAVATGAGAEGRNSVGTAVAGGMFFATFLNVLFIPVLYVVVQTLRGATSRQVHADE